MNNKILTKLILSTYLGITGCTEREPAEVVGKVKYGLCDREENIYNLRLTNAEVYLEESDKLKANKDLSAYHPGCDLFELVPEGTPVRVLGDYEYDVDRGITVWSNETYRLDTEELIYPVKKE